LKYKHFPKLFEKYKCKLCNRAFIKLQSIEKHLQSNHYNTKSKKVWKYKGENSKEFVNTNIIFNEDLRDYTCPLCEYSYPSSEILQVHADYIHLDIPPKCPICSFEGNFEIVIAHIKMKHLKMERYKCKLCEHGTDTLKIIEDHIYNVHSGH
jgi:rubrerythrin